MPKDNNETNIIKDSQLFGIKKKKSTESEGSDFELYGLKIDGRAQSKICEIFSNAISDSLSKDVWPFDPGYTIKKEDNAIFSIKDFKLPDNIINAVKNPETIESYHPRKGFKKEDMSKDINALFIGCETTSGFAIGFQAVESGQL